MIEKSLVLDNVLFINSKEETLKKLMSRLEVRVTTDQEVGEREHVSERLRGRAMARPGDRHGRSRPVRWIACPAGGAVGQVGLG